MSLDLFRLISGIDIINDAGTSNANIIQGIGAPGGDASVQDAAPIGSVYLRTDVESNNLQLYIKWSTSYNSAQDWRTAATKEYVDAVAQGISWREPARVIDVTSYADSTLFPVSGTIDGVALNNGDRVLFSNVAQAGQKNVWIWNSSNSSWTEDTNQESDGDALLVQAGSNAETQWVFDGTNWVQFGGSASQSELADIRDYIGKTGPGAEMPTYSSTNVVAQGSNLETAIGALDEIHGNGAITNDTTDNVGTHWSISDDLISGAGTLTVTDVLNQLNNAIGNRDYSNNSQTGLVDGESLATSIEKLNSGLTGVITQTDTFAYSNVSGTSTVDTIPIADATEAKWLIQVRSHGTPANRKAMEVHAINDGSAAVDFTNYAVIKVGAALNFSVSVVISGTDMLLKVTAGTAVDIVVKRIGFSAF